MKQTSLADYAPGEFASSLFVADAKLGKTCALAAWALGVLPGQTSGGVVDNPANLHIISVDAGAVQGLGRFLTETCKAPKEVSRITVYNLEAEARHAAQTDYDYTFYNAVINAIRTAQSKMKSGVGVLLVSSLTGVALACERGIAGPPARSGKSGTGMDLNKWSEMSRQIAEIRNVAQQDFHHCWWEGHLYKTAARGDEPSKETIQVSGKSGSNFSFNVHHVFRIRREFGSKYPGTNCDRVYLDTRPALGIISGGRGFTENLDPKETCMTTAFKKLGLKRGRWGRKAKEVTP